MKKILTLLVILGLNPVLFSQEAAWVTFMGGPGPQFATDIKQASDGGYIIAAYGSEGFGGNFYIVKLDEAGTVLWEKNFSKDNYSERAYSIHEMASGEYVVTGTATMLNRPWLVNLNIDGDTLWTSGSWTDTLPQNSGVLARSTILNDGRVVVIGAEGQYGLKPNMFIVSPDGDLLEQRELNGPVPPGWLAGTFITHVEPASDGGFVCTGSAGSGTASRAFIWKFDSNADSAWTVHFDEPGYGMRIAQSIRQLSDGGFILAGADSPNADNTTLLRTDSDGNPVWIQSYPDTIYTNATDVIERNNGIFIVTEKRFEAIGETIFTSALLKIDQNGMLITRDIITRDGSSVAIYRAQNTTDGGFVLAGEINEIMVPNEQDLFVLKSDPEGNIANAFFDILLSVNDIATKNNEAWFNIAPTPVRSGQFVTITSTREISSVDIHSLSGAAISSHQTNNKLDFKIPAPKNAGIYHIVSRMDSGEILVRRLVVSGR